MKTQVTRFVGLASAALLLAASTFARFAGRRSAAAGTARAGELRVLDVQGNIKMIVGAGANIAASIGREGVLLVDSGNAASSEKLIALVRELSPALPVQYMLNTQFHDDHTGGNDALSKIGRRLVGGEMVIIGHEQVLNRMTAPTGSVSPRPVQAWPTDTFFAQRERGLLQRRAGADVPPARPDRWQHHRLLPKVRRRRRGRHLQHRLVAASSTWRPAAISTASSKALNDILDLTVPANNVEDGTLVIPGSGG